MADRTNHQRTVNSAPPEDNGKIVVTVENLTDDDITLCSRTTFTYCRQSAGRVSNLAVSLLQCSSLAGGHKVSPGTHPWT